MAQLTAMPGASRPKPTPDQHRAADPESSVWVGASAGAGKTRVLADRLLRLLIQGADPASILCLTFTKAGAAEMARRIQDDLARYAAYDEATLAVELQNLLDRPADAIERRRAREGLLRVLDLPGGLLIMTIHSFCQSLLARFPLEAGVSPHFELLDERAAAILRRQARDEVLLDRSPAIRAAIERLAVALGEHSLTEGLNALSAKRDELTRLLAEKGGDVEALVEEVCAALGVEPDATAKGAREAACRDLAIDEPGLLAAASALAASKNENDQARGLTIQRWLAADDEGRGRAFADYEAVFLRKDREPKAQRNVATKPVLTAHPHVWPILEAEQSRLAAAAEREKAAAVAERTAALLRVGAAIIEAYERRKQNEGKLDFADLIERSRALLADPDAGAWVRFKLDQRIDHLLIDESQDTSPTQWAIIEALIDDFWTGEGLRETPPTLFVVGDDKQSIFGFQGADVDAFEAKRRAFRARAEAAGRTWRDVQFQESFRSAPAILEAVDATLFGGERRHQASRRNAKGLIELWPLFEGEKAEDPEPWAFPDQASPPASAEHELARTIAFQIQSWLTSGAWLAYHERPIRPGDIMILLPRRGVLQDLLVRALKKQAVPVAGADRIGLAKELAVRDLVALGDALLLPEDDLTFATVLKSPLFNIRDELLFKLAYDRGEASLFERLRELRNEEEAFAEADDRFRRLLALVDHIPPYEFYARLLGEQPFSGRRRLLARLGEAALLPIETFLAQAVAYERANPPSMQGFLHWLRADDSAIKRDAQETRDEVRVMTVHGSKGLEAPIVFLADATYRKTLGKEKLLWRNDGLPFWKMSKERLDPYSRGLLHAEEARQLKEHSRLLYVAMTRAEERLIVAGCARKGDESSQSERDAAGASWYEQIKAGLKRLPNAAVVSVRLPSGPKVEVIRFGDAPPDPSPSDQASFAFPEDRRGGDPLPEWLQRAARGEIRPEPLRPSADLEAEDPPAASPRGREGERRFGRGLLIHKLLQILPSLPAESRDQATRRYLSKPGLGLDRRMQDEIAAEVGAIFDNPAWSDLFGPSSRAEAPLVGEVGGRRVSGQVDRLSVLDDQVLVVDYKTNRPPPREQGDVPAAYGRQMAIYRALLRQIYPDHPVRCALLWTEGPRLMPLDDRWLDAFERP